MKRDEYSEMLQAYGQAYLERILSPEGHRRYAEKVSTNIASDSEADKWDWCDCCGKMQPSVHICQ